VKKGELLANIDTPEVDQELTQARATRQQILSQMELAKISADRWENLRKSDSVSAQEADQQSSGYQQAKANLAAADANVRRLEEMESFKNVYAPFSGVLTRRNVIIILMSIELILNAVNINLVAFSRMWGNIDGQIFAIFIITDAAAEAAVGLGIIIAFFRNRPTVLADEMDLLKW